MIPHLPGPTKQSITRKLAQPPANDIINAMLTNNTFQFTLVGAPGSYYVIQAATDLNGPWINVGTNQADPNNGSMKPGWLK